jgi:hypothetical protein
MITTSSLGILRLRRRMRSDFAQNDKFFEMAWLTARETRALTLVWSMDAVWSCRADVGHSVSDTSSEKARRMAQPQSREN